jgi:hypothetical protein
VLLGIMLCGLGGGAVGATVSWVAVLKM